MEVFMSHLPHRSNILLRRLLSSPLLSIHLFFSLLVVVLPLNQAFSLINPDAPWPRSSSAPAAQQYQQFCHPWPCSGCPYDRKDGSFPLGIALFSESEGCGCYYYLMPWMSFCSVSSCFKTKFISWSSCGLKPAATETFLGGAYPHPPHIITSIMIGM